MRDELRQQMYNELNLRETEDLLEIWRTNDHEEWSDTAFVVIKEILSERLGEVPPQEILGDEQEKERFEDDGLDEWEAKVLDSESQPEFYSTLEVIKLKDNINKTAKAVIVINVLGSLTTFQWFSSIVGSYFPNRQELMPLIYLISFIVAGLSAAVAIAVVYFPLKALTQILRILMEMEFRSRKAN